MPGRLGPRFAVEAAFLILLGIGAALADLSPQWIVAVMGAGWVLVGLFEFTADRLGSVFPPLQRYGIALPPPEAEAAPEPEVEEATIAVPPPAPAEEPIPARASLEPLERPKRRWFRRRREPDEETEENVLEPPRHVRLLPRSESSASDEAADVLDADHEESRR